MVGSDRWCADGSSLLVEVWYVSCFRGFAVPIPTIPYTQGVLDWIDGQPFIIAVGFLTLVAAVRSQATYWVGRGIRAGAVRTAWAKKMTSDKGSRAVALLERRGWPVIPLSFLTVGLQTGVQAAAGLLGWRWLPYTLASIPGWLLWGVIYAAGGLAAFVALFSLAQRAWWLAALVVVVIAAIIVVIVRWRRKRRRAVVAEPQG